MRFYFGKDFPAEAVSAAVMMPFGVQAEDGLSVYGSIRNAVYFNDPGGADTGKDSTTDVSSIGSRLGFKGSADLGNGLTARGHYEFGLGTHQQANGLANRIATVGVAGGFGSIDIGNQWSAYYNTTGVDMDPTPFLGGILGTVYRASNTIKYANSVGPLTIEADLRLNGGGDEPGTDGADHDRGLAGEGGGLGVRVAVTDNLTLAAAYDVEDRSDNLRHVYTPAVAAQPANNVAIAVPKADAVTGRGPEFDRVGVSGKLELGQFWGTLSWSSKNVTGTATDRSEKETEYAQLFIGASLTDSTSGWVGYGQSETEGSNLKPSAVNVGLSHSLGGGLSVFYEGKSSDNDMANQDSSITHYAALRFDF